MAGYRRTLCVIRPQGARLQPYCANPGLAPPTGSHHFLAYNWGRAAGAQFRDSLSKSIAEPEWKQRSKMETAKRLRGSEPRSAKDGAKKAELGEYGVLIGGIWLKTGDAIEVHSPFNDALVAVVHRAGPKEIEQAIATAVEAFQVTRKLPAWKRAEVLMKVSQGIAARREELARTIALEAGKPIRTARLEVARAALTFPGRPAVGVALKARAGRKRVTLELGANAGVIVHEDADLKYAAERVAWGGFSFAGQSCISVQRVYIAQPVYEEF